jgi:hypothetical protein
MRAPCALSPRSAAPQSIHLRIGNANLLRILQRHVPAEPAGRSRDDHAQIPHPCIGCFKPLEGPTLHSRSHAAPCSASGRTGHPRGTACHRCCRSAGPRQLLGRSRHLDSVCPLVSLQPRVSSSALIFTGLDFFSQTFKLFFAY